jgi:hypothetical protein
MRRAAFALVVLAACPSAAPSPAVQPPAAVAHAGPGAATASVSAPAAAPPFAGVVDDTQSCAQASSGGSVDAAMDAPKLAARAELKALLPSGTRFDSERYCSVACAAFPGVTLVGASSASALGPTGPSRVYVVEGSRALEATWDYVEVDGTGSRDVRRRTGLSACPTRNTDDFDAWLRSDAAAQHDGCVDWSARIVARAGAVLGATPMDRAAVGAFAALLAYLVSEQGGAAKIVDPRSDGGAFTTAGSTWNRPRETLEAPFAAASSFLLYAEVEGTGLVALRFRLTEGGGFELVTEVVARPPPQAVE